MTPVPRKYYLVPTDLLTTLLDDIQSRVQPTSTELIQLRRAIEDIILDDTLDEDTQHRLFTKLLQEFLFFKHNVPRQSTNAGDSASKSNTNADTSTSASHHTGSVIASAAERTLAAKAIRPGSRGRKRQRVETDFIDEEEKEEETERPTNHKSQANRNQEKAKEEENQIPQLPAAPSLNQDQNRQFVNYITTHTKVPPSYTTAAERLLNYLLIHPDVTVNMDTGVIGTHGTEIPHHIVDYIADVVSERKNDLHSGAVKFAQKLHALHRVRPLPSNVHINSHLKASSKPVGSASAGVNLYDSWKTLRK